MGVRWVPILRQDRNTSAVKQFSELLLKMGYGNRRTRPSASSSSSAGQHDATVDSHNPYLQHRQKESESINKFTKKPYSTRYYDILRTRKTLPIYSQRAKLLQTIETNKIVVLEGETGSGKTTQVPQFLVEAGYADGDAIVCCTQPRRVAAISVSRRVAEEMDVSLGAHVGYTVRFDDNSCSRTRLKYLTDGMLLREAMVDPTFSSYSVIILDEAHERTLSTDILMGILKTVIQKRDDLRIVIMSATIDAAKFQRYFNDAPLLSVPGRMFPVEIFYSSEPEGNYVDAAVRTITEICEKEPPGDILIFLTGEDEIEEVCARVEDVTRPKQHIIGPIRVYPLYGALPPDVQQRVFEKPPGPLFNGGPPGRKVICATNIAETSLTIDGVVYVVDTGLSKQKIYNPRARVESLLVDYISQASAKQRAGRAGRTQKGKCFRLYTKTSFEEDLLQTSHPEILRSNLGNVVLQMLKLGVEDLVHFDFMDAPAPESMMRALEMLNYLGAIDDEGRLTSFGDRMSSFPLEPEASAALIRSAEFNCSSEIVTIVSMLSEASNCFINLKKRNMKRDRGGRNIAPVSPRRQFEDGLSDHITYINVYRAYQHALDKDEDPVQWCRRNFLNHRALRSAHNVRRQLLDLLRKANVELCSTDAQDATYSKNIRRALLCGYFMQVAHRTDKRGWFKTAKDEELVQIHKTSALKKDTPWVMYHEFVLMDDDRSLIRTCSEVEAKWLVKIAPHYFDLSNFPSGVMKDALERVYRSNKKQRNVVKP